MNTETSETSMEAERAAFLAADPFPGYDLGEVLELRERVCTVHGVDTQLGRKVVLRAVLPDLDAREDALERFFQDARNVAPLRHDGIVRGLDTGRAGDWFYLAYERARGETLAQKLARLERGRLQEAEIIRILGGIAEALQCAFENGLIHRHLEPGSILLDPEGGVRLLDLGFGRDLQYDSDGAWLHAEPWYASPELIADEPNIDIRSDLYRLGAIAFQALLGQPVYGGLTPEEVLRGHREREFPNPREIDVRVSAATSQLLAALLEKDRDERPRTPQAFLAKVRNHPLYEAGKARVSEDATAAEPARESATE